MAKRLSVYARSNKSLAVQCVADSGHKDAVQVISYHEVHVAGVILRLLRRERNYNLKNYTDHYCGRQR